MRAPQGTPKPLATTLARAQRTRFAVPDTIWSLTMVSKTARRHLCAGRNDVENCSPTPLGNSQGSASPSRRTSWFLRACERRPGRETLCRSARHPRKHSNRSTLRRAPKLLLRLSNNRAACPLAHWAVVADAAAAPGLTPGPMNFLLKARQLMTQPGEAGTLTQR